ncbi:hypothetical protein ACI2KD_01225 [Pseudomonas monteilii]
MYAIAFDLDQATLRDTYRNESYNNAYADIRKFLEAKGFTRQQGSVYFGGADMTAVKCVLAAQALAREFDWFKPSISDIRMLRIEEMNDLSEAL